MESGRLKIFKRSFNTAQDVVNDLRAGKNDPETLYKAANLLDERSYIERSQQRDFYAFCIGMGFLLIVILVVFAKLL